MKEFIETSATGLTGHLLVGVTHIDRIALETRINLRKRITSKAKPTLTSCHLAAAFNSAYQNPCVQLAGGITSSSA